MSPRSREFMDQAHEALASARLVCEHGFFARAVSNGYYAMLYAARAALSEEDRYAKTHSGTWNLFRETFVEPGRFDAQLLAAASAQQKPREDADYEAERFSREQAAEAVELAERFIAAVTELIGD
jgi:uncharacterized protein (UPF0332 family)